MAIWIALFRSINIGGHQSLPMKALTATLEKAGFDDVRTYIQSGNAVFRSASGTAASLARRIGTRVLEAHGFEPKVIVLSAKELAQAAAGNPFPRATENPKSLHLFFLSERPREPDIRGLENLRAGREAFALEGTVFYLYAPDGIGKSKLAARAERLIGVDATARNWRTVAALLEMASAVKSS